MAFFDHLFTRVDTRLGSAVVRQCLQSVTAVLITFYAAILLDVDETYWAVLSAAYVLHHSVDGTVRAVLERMVATIAGSAVGLASVIAAPGADMSPLRLVIVTGALSAVAGVWPGMWFSIVPALVLVLPSAEEPTAAALSRSGSVLLGGLIGFLTSALVWPQSSKERALGALTAALTNCRELADSDLGRLIDEHATSPDFAAVHRSFWKHLNRAHDNAQRMLASKPLRSGAPLPEVVDGVERLWYALVAVDHLCSSRRALAHNRYSADVLRAVREIRGSVCLILDELCQALQNDGAGVPSADLQQSMRQARATVQACTKGGRPSGSAASVEAPAIIVVLDDLNEAAAELFESFTNRREFTSRSRDASPSSS